MPFDMGDFDHDTGGGFGPYEAEVVNAGVGIGKYGPEILLVCKPTNPNRGVQNLHMGIGKEGKFEFGGTQQVITTGKGEKAFDVTVYDEIVSGPKIKVVTKGGLFLNALKHLGFNLSNVMSTYIGLKVDLEEIKSPEAIRRFNEIHPDNTLEVFGKEYNITIPTKIIELPAKKVPLEEKILDFVSTGKSEKEVIAWCNETNTPMRDVFANLDSRVEEGSVVLEGKTYLVLKNQGEEGK